jgi:outer membrane protein TolC
MFKYSIFSFLFAFVIGYSEVAWCQLDVDDLVEQAIKNSYQLEANNYQILRSKSLNTKGVAGNLPRVSLSGNVRTDINNIRLQFFDNREISQNNADNYSAGTNLDVEYSLFEGGAKEARKNELRINAELSEMDYQTQKEEILRQLLNGLAEYQLHYRQMKVYAQDTLHWARLLKLRSEMKSLGRGDETDLVQIEAELNRSRIQFQRANQAALLARNQVEALAFIDPSTEIEIDNLQIFLESKMVSPTDLGPADLQRIQLELTESNTLLSLSKSAMYPTVSIFAGYGFSWSRNAVGVLLSNQNFGPYGGLNLNWTLYDGKRLQREEEAAELDALSQRESLNQQKRDITYAKREFKKAIETEREIIEQEKKQQKILRRQYEIFENQYREGQTSILEVLTYRRQLRLSQLNANSANFQLIQYLIEWVYYDGQLRQM